MIGQLPVLRYIKNGNAGILNRLASDPRNLVAAILFFFEHRRNLLHAST